MHSHRITRTKSLKTQCIQLSSVLRGQVEELLVGNEAPFKTMNQVLLIFANRWTFPIWPTPHSRSNRAVEVIQMVV